MSAENPTFETKTEETSDLSEVNPSMGNRLERKNLETIADISNSLSPLIRESEVIVEESKDKALLAL